MKGRVIQSAIASDGGRGHLKIITTSADSENELVALTLAVNRAGH